MLLRFIHISSHSAIATQDLYKYKTFIIYVNFSRKQKISTFSNAFSQIKILYFDSNFIESALVQVMALRRTGDKPLPGPMLAEFTDAYMRNYGEMS